MLLQTIPNHKPPQVPLYLRISDTDLHIARYDKDAPSSFAFATHHLRPQLSLTMNLREALDAVDLLKQPADRVEMIINTPVTPVPLQDFQEEDCERIYAYCFEQERKVRVFYDTVPAANVVLLFGLEDLMCHTLEEAFGTVRYSSAQTAVLQHFSGKANDTSASRRRLFVYTHEGRADISVFDDQRLLMFNSYAVHALTDVDYYTFNLARHMAYSTADEPIFVAGDEALRTPVVEELQKYAKRVYAINPAADFNRHPAAAAPGIPYDLIVKLLG